MTRSQHIYYFLHHDIYLPISASFSPYSTLIVRPLALCPDAAKPYDDIDNLCASIHKSQSICRLITLNGSWSPNDPKRGKCTWKIGRPDDAMQWGITDRPFQEKEPFILAVLPRPEIYRWRRWLNTSSLLPTNRSLAMIEFKKWASDQSTTLMLDELIPVSHDSNQNDSRITRILNAMRTGQALLMTEEFITNNQVASQKDFLERWISAHLGFFITIPSMKINLRHDRLTALEESLFSGDDLFYREVHQENQRWTKNWNYWRNKFYTPVIKHLKKH